MRHFAASHQGLFCLSLSHKKDARFKFIGLLYSSDNDKIQIGLIMDGDRNYFLGGDKPSANTAVQGTITPENTNANGKMRLNFNLYFTSSPKHVHEMYTPLYPTFIK